MSKHPLVCDTTIPLYLGRVGQIDLLPALFAPVYVPEQVCLELDMGRVLRPDTINPRSLAWVELVSVSQVMIDRLLPNRLGTGERAVIAFRNGLRRLEQHRLGAVAILDASGMNDSIQQIAYRIDDDVSLASIPRREWR